MSNKVTVYKGDNRDHLRRLIDEGVRVHSVVTDPPYGLSFMGKKWDSSMIERDPEFWSLVHEILLPGGYVFAFSGSRTGHWQACAMELAGFIMHPMHGWVYGSGMPKAHAADKAIDKHLGANGTFGEPKSAAHAGWVARGRMRGGEDSDKHEGWQRPWMEDSEQVDNAARKYIAGSPEAAQWEGWAYGTQAQKPAIENLYLGQKPFADVEVFRVLVLDSLLKQMRHRTCQSEVFGAELIKSASIADVLITLKNLGLIEQNIAQNLVRLLQELETVQRTGAVGNILAWTDMLSSELGLNTSSNTAKSWLTSLVALWSLGNTFTTAITSDTITDLKIWNLLAGQIIHESTTHQSELIGEASNVIIAGQCLKRACASLLSRISTIATEIVIAQLAPTDGDRAVGSNAHVQPIYLGQKPFSEKTGAANLLKHGVGAVNIDGCRVPGIKDVPASVSRGRNGTSLEGSVDGSLRHETGVEAGHNPNVGRHPANLILDGSPEVVAMFPNGKSGKPGVRRKNHETHSMSGRLKITGETEIGYGDEGSAARFFHHFPPDTDPLFYHPKAGKADRAGSKHPTVKPIALMQYLVRHITPPGGIVLDPFAGSGTTGEAARREGFDCILIEKDPEYAHFLETRFKESSTVFD